MKYMGSKSRIKKEVLPIIQRETNKYNLYVEPFVGGANVIDDIGCEKKIGYDINIYLIELLNYVKYGGKLPEDLTRELYSDVRDNQESGKYEKWFVGAIGFLGSYNGRWFDGGYAKPSEKRNYFDEAKRNLIKQSEKFKDIEFIIGDFNELEVKNAMIYCDPPYKGTKQYGINKKFDNDLFWDKVRYLTKDNYVIVSEENAPKDFVCIWEKEITRTIKAKDKSTSTEKLFIHRSLINEQATDNFGKSIKGETK